ncbi:TRAPP complex subunit Trs120 [Schizosaccharomyces cryophilus OY26]|uniref:TRAPP complex subunit Trs120 n=1 Tax=Schizosaccharomyces cryophilus (strain OY26 / ATCC MYA-4695 / CBS 11777 / NBRC 106824 / NRRL Y48691) TaxID=653667 RepID=S9W127_SCHCR|nr:TRAPP complex subunit Trs120 [Schizosaccharomyces cryophilus OY26]EPY52174.1 TRAPP complex subunit Trs120 [Schizosaccharomyces cryophilus OY26]
MVRNTIYKQCFSSILSGDAMEFDFFSFVAPSRIQALACPFGRIRRHRFHSFLELLRRVSHIQLSDIPVGRATKKSSSFNPLAFPLGRIIYNFTTTLDDQQSLLEEYEYFRRIFVFIGVIDGSEQQDFAQLQSSLDAWQRRVPHASVAKCLVFDCSSESEGIYQDPRFVLGPRSNSSVNSVMRSILCDITAELLEEFSSLEFSLHARSVILSPMTEMPHLAPLQRTNSFSSMRSPRSSTTTPVSRTTSIPSVRSVTAVTDRSKSLSKGRIENQLGQLYLLAGRLPNALKHFANAIATTKSTSDYLWQGLSLELFTVCLVLMAQLHIDVQIPHNITAMFPSYTDRFNEHGPLKLDFLFSFIAETRNAIDQLYHKSTLQPNDSIPGLCFSESILRFSHLLTIVYVCNGLTDVALNHIISQSPLRSSKISASYVPSKATIYQWVIRARGQHLNYLSIRENCRIYGAMANMLGTIGFHRQRSKMLRDMLFNLTPSIVELRKQIAFKIGIHPEVVTMHTASSLDRSKIGFNILPLILEVCEEFGLLRLDGTVLNPETTKWGWTSLQFDVINELISFCEALADYQTILKLISLFFTISPSYSTSAQQNFLYKIFRKTCSFASNLGITIQTPYWDPFMITDMQYNGNPDFAEPRLVHVKASKANSSQGRSPFIYNPFLKKDTDHKKRNILVVDEPVFFNVYLRNPFHFSVDIQEIYLDTEGVEVKHSTCMSTLRPLSTEMVSLSIIPLEAGTLNVRGCNVKVFGCEPSVQYFYDKEKEKDALHISLEKIKHDFDEMRPPNVAKHQWSNIPKLSINLESLNFHIIEKQPTLIVSSKKFSISNLNFAEYETGELLYTIENVSNTKATHVRVSFDDNASKVYEQLKSDKNVTADLLYELQHEEYELPTFNVLNEQTFALQPGEKRQIHVNVFAKPISGMGAIIFESSCRNDDESDFYARHLKLPIALNLSKRVTLSGWSVLPDIEKNPNYCMLLLNFYNHHSDALRVSLKKREKDVIESRFVKPKADHVFFLRLKRFRMSEAQLNRDIPNLSFKQFVLSSGMKRSLENITALKRRFWVKQHLMEEIQAFWESDEQNRHGQVYMKYHSLTDDMTQQLLLPSIQISAHSKQNGETTSRVLPRKPFTLVLSFDSSEENLRYKLSWVLLSRDSPTTVDRHMGLIMDGPNEAKVSASEKRDNYLVIERNFFALTPGIYQIYISAKPESDDSPFSNCDVSEPIVLHIETS